MPLVACCLRPTMMVRLLACLRFVLEVKEAKGDS